MANVETWLVLACLAVCIVAIGRWIVDAGDDWLAPKACWDTTTRHACGRHAQAAVQDAAGGAAMTAKASGSQEARA